MSHQKQTLGSEESKRNPTTNIMPKDGCCEIHMNLENKGTVNIFNCPPVISEKPSGEPGSPVECPPTATGACVPLALGRKPKKSLDAKLAPLLENNKVPSALAAGFSV